MVSSSNPYLPSGASALTNTVNTPSHEKQSTEPTKPSTPSAEGSPAPTGFRKRSGRQSGSPKPLRQFTHAPVEKLPSPWQVRFQQSAFWLVPLLVVVLVGVVGVVIALQQSMSRGIRDEATAGTALVNAPVAELRRTDPSAILSSHLEAVGGRRAQGNLRSMAVSGRVDDGREVFSAQIFGLGSEQAILVMKRRDGQSERHVQNGTIFWRQVQGFEATTYGGLEAREVLALQATTRLHDPLVAVAVEGTGMIASAREARYMGREVFELKIDQFDGSEALCYLEKDTFNLIGTKETRRVGDQSFEIESRMSEFRLVSGIVRPHATVVRINGELHHRFDADNVRFNSGVMTSLFEIPEAVRALP